MDNSYNILKNNLKRERKHSATKLPHGITQDMLPKYVVYHRECYNKEKELYRDYFKIDKHPIIKGKSYTSSKSNKISPLEKLLQIKNLLYSIENNIEEMGVIIDVSLNDISANDLSTNNMDIVSKKPIENKKTELVLPKYVSIKLNTENNKLYMIYDKKIGDNRFTFRKIYDYNRNLSLIIKDFEEKVTEKIL